MAKKKRKAPSFNDYYEEIFDERWPALCAALKKDPRYFTLSEGLVKPYFLDRASYMAARSLPVGREDRILDLCAAPGGKTLVLASQLSETNELTANDKSPARKRRLLQVLREHLPEEVFRKIRITNYDASKWCLYEDSCYDKILLDVPCSSERHIINSEKHLLQWSPARTKHLSIQAYSILSSAFTLLKPGGILVYSTCALSPLENDEVIGKLLKRRGDETEIIPPQAETGEPTRFGWQILPDTCNGMGPIYFSRIGKMAG